MYSTPYGPRILGKDRFFFEKKTISSATFNNDADFLLPLISKNSVLLTNDGSGVVEYSFNGIAVHGELNPILGKHAMTIQDPSIVKIWFRLKSGAASVVSVQNDSSLIANINVDLSGSSFGGTSSTFNDVFPALGTAVGFTDGYAMQGSRVYDVDSGAGTEYVLGAVLRSSANGGSLELGTNTNPLRINPTGTTAQPVTDNGSSLTVDGSVTANIGTTNGLALDATLTNGTQKSIIRSGAKGTTAAADVTSENVDENTQALHVYIKGNSTDGYYPLVLDGYASIDGFGRFRVSSPYTIFENKQIHNNQSYIWNEALTAGGTSTYSQNRASTTISVFNTGDKVIRQTKSRFNYQSGLSYLILNTFVLGPAVSGVSKKIGYFDENNGIYFENDGTVNKLVIRNNASGMVIPEIAVQSSWNLDTLDGYGPSGITLDITKCQIFAIDVEWLGVGSVRCGFVIDGKTYYVHKFNHANIFNSVYMSTPNLPIRSEIENISGGAVSANLEQICCSVMSEGGYINPGLSFAIDRGVSALTNVTNANLFPLLSVRLTTTGNGAVVIPESIDILCTSSNANFRWALVVNPTINGVDAASWTTLTSSVIEYDVTRGITNYITGGYMIASGYGTQKASPVSSAIQGAFRLGSSIAGVRDQLVLAVQKIASGGNDDFIASMSWKEYS